jgi:nitrate reductase gamma subunit
MVSLSKIIKVARMPVHLRWELYPVPHERGRAHYGGSKLEDTKWYEHEHKPDHLNEIKEMATEIVFLKAVWEFNRSLWIGTFPFHFGLYMTIVNMALLFIAGILKLNGFELLPGNGSIAEFGYYLIYSIAWVSSIIGVFGAIRLMFSRVVDQGLRNHSSVSHYFNILFIGGIFFTIMLWLIFDPNFVSTLTNFYASLITFSALPELHTIAVIHIIFVALFILYMPFTHMSHMYMKYFLYHYVRWEDHENKAGSTLSEKLGKQFAYPLTWSAAHIGADGKKNWGDVVAEIPKDK